ncbi:MAG: DNA primase [Spirochaetota bacterium]
MRIPDSVIESVRDQVDIVDVVGEYVALTRRGNRYWGLSPFTQEKTPSFTVSPDRGLFYCFSTNKGGNLFTFVMEMERVSFPEAVRMLARRVGIEIAEDSDPTEVSSREPLRELYRRVCGSFRYLLKSHAEGREAREYLKRRGISPDTQEAFQLGWAPKDAFWLYKFLLQKSYSAEFLATSGLFTRANPRRALFAGRLMFPIVSRNGDVIAFGGRLLSGDGPKYLNSPNTDIFQKSRELYGLYPSLQSIRSSGDFILVEGYTDVLAMHQAGVRNAVAPLGTAFTPEQAKSLSRFVERAVLILDADRAGFAASMKASIICEQHDIRPTVVELPAGKDPADLLVEGGEAVLQESAVSAISSLEYFTGVYGTRSQSDSPEGKELVLRELFPYIQSIRSEVRQEASLAYIADTLDLQRSSIIREFEKRKQGLKPGSVSQDESNKRMDSLSEELYLMLAVAVNCEHFPLVRTILQVDDLSDNMARDLYIALEESYRAEESDFDRILARVEDQRLHQLLYERAAGDEFSVNTEQVVRDAVRAVKRRAVETKLRSVQSQLRSADNSVEEQRRLMTEKAYLDGELQKLKVVQHG